MSRPAQVLASNAARLLGVYSDGVWPGSIGPAAFYKILVDARQGIGQIVCVETRGDSAMSEFEKWRKACGLSVNETAELLGMTRQNLHLLRQGRAPKMSVLRLMSVIAAGQRPEPWPMQSAE
jgi:hypothetical protein